MLGVLLALALGTTGGLYFTGYWDATWQDKKPELKAAIKADINPEAPEEAKEMLAECLADKWIAIVATTTCKPAKGPVQDQVVACIKANDKGQEAGASVLQCVMETQIKMMNRAGEQAPSDQ